MSLSEKRCKEGLKQYCTKPTAHSNNVTVGVAVAVPVGVIVIVLVVILWLGYRKSKKEAQEEEYDPEFEGDSEYLPTQNRINVRYGHSSDSGSHGTVPDEKQISHPYNLPNVDRTLRNDSEVSSRNFIQPSMTDPFQLPHMNQDSNSLRDFARQINNEKNGGYSLATGSRTTSQATFDMRPNQPYSAQRQYSASSLSLGQSRPHASRSLVNTKISDVPVSLDYNSKPIAEKMSDLEGDASMISDQHNEKNVEAEDLTREDPEFFFEDDNEDEVSNTNPFTKSNSVSNEEENIERMKSIYKVYLDRNPTQRAPEPEYDISQHEPLSPSEDHDILNDYADPDPDARVDETAITNSATIVTELQTSQSTQAIHNEAYGVHNEKQMDTLQVNEQHARVASSIYSDVPSLQPSRNSAAFNQAEILQEQLAVSNTDANPFYANQEYNHQHPYEYSQNYQSQEGYYFYNQENPSNVNMPAVAYNLAQQQHFNHPQNLESIGELPTPTQLAFSNSSHSLTSFKGKNKGQQFETARLNGTALNPMDHPDMFYSNDSNNAYYQNQQSGGALLPHQMRQSVVMTNPSSLSTNRRFKPAGSIRNYTNPNMFQPQVPANNNLYTSDHQQHQFYQSRVSGLLDAEDVLQPPSVGRILPSSGSNDDLRKQLGTSHNYKTR